jgi:hypothetical protein
VPGGDEIAAKRAMLPTPIPATTSVSRLNAVAFHPAIAYA